MSRPVSEPHAREVLPQEASGLPPLGPDAMDTLTEGLRDLGLEPSPSVVAAIDAHARLLVAWSRHVNLTAIREPVQVVRLHILDSLSAVAPVRARMGAVRSVVDIGSGGGYPGIPVALALGATRLTLVESVGRKARFLEVVGAACEAILGDGRWLTVEVRPVRAEQLAAEGRRGAWDVATMRAVGHVAECAELALPLLRAGGLLVCWKRGPAAAPDASDAVRSEVEAAVPLIGRLGGGIPEVVPGGVPGAPGHRLVLVRKERPTPRAFPRSPTVRRSSLAQPRPRSGGRPPTLLIV